MFFYKLILKLVFIFKYDRLYIDTKNLLNRWFKITNVLVEMFFLFLSLKLIQLILYTILVVSNFFFVVVYIYFIIKNLYYDTNNISTINIILNLKSFIKINYKNFCHKLQVKAAIIHICDIVFAIMRKVSILLIAGVAVIRALLHASISLTCTLYYIFLILFQVVRLTTLTLLTFFLHIKFVNKHITYVLYVYIFFAPILILLLKIIHFIQRVLYVFFVALIYFIYFLKVLSISYIHDFFSKNLTSAFKHLILFIDKSVVMSSYIYMFFFKIVVYFYFFIRLSLIRLFRFILEILFIVLYRNYLVANLLVPAGLSICIFMKIYMRLFKQVVLYFTRLLTIRLLLLIQQILYIFTLMFLNYGSFLFLFYDRKKKSLRLFRKFFKKLIVFIKKLNLIRKRRALVKRLDNRNRNLIHKMAKKRSLLILKSFKESRALAIKNARRNSILIFKTALTNFFLDIKNLSVLFSKVLIFNIINSIVYNFLFITRDIIKFVKYVISFFLPTTEFIVWLTKFFYFKILLKVKAAKLSIFIIVVVTKLYKLCIHYVLYFFI